MGKMCSFVRVKMESMCTRGNTGGGDTLSDPKIRKFFRVDGFVRRQPEQRDLVLEYFGCYYHACPLHYPRDDRILADGRPAGEIRRRDAERIAELERAGFEVRIKWECAVDRRLACKPEMAEYFDACLDTGPIHIHDAFFGGRTSCEWTICSTLECNAGHFPMEYGHRTIKYKDFV